MMTPKERAQLAAKIKQLTAELEAAVAEEVAEMQRQSRADSGGNEGAAIPDGVMRQLATRGEHCLCRVVGRILEQKQKEPA